RQPPRMRGPEGRPGERPFDGPPGERTPPDDFRAGPPGPKEFHLPPQQARLFDESDTNGFYYIIWRRDGSELARSSNAPAIDRKMYSVPVTNSRVQDNPVNEMMGPPELRRGRPTPQPPQMIGTFRETQMLLQGQRILVGRSIARQLADLRGTALVLTGVGAGILLLGLMGGWWLASRAIRPIEDISATAVKISGGDLAQRINVDETESELGRLASVLNSTFARLDAAFTQQRQFASDAAHELRTPVSVMLTQTQTTLNRERSAAE